MQLMWLAYRWTHDDKYLRPLQSELTGGTAFGELSELNANVLDLLSQRAAWGAASRAETIGDAVADGAAPRSGATGGAAREAAGARGRGSGAVTDSQERHVEFEHTRSIDITFAPRVTTVLDLELETPGKPLWDRPDVGLGASDVHVAKGNVRVTVHSLGSVPAPPSTVTLIDAAGREVAHAQVPAIPAPLDLLPKTAQVTLRVGSGVRTSGAKVRVRLDGQTQEITQLNNEVVLP
jgi:hypothetical protein